MTNNAIESRFPRTIYLNVNYMTAELKRWPDIYSMKFSKLLKPITAVALLLFIGSSGARGQACCSGGSPVSGVMGVTSSEKQDLRLMVTYNQHFMNRLYNGSELLEIDDRRRRIHNLMVEGSYGFSDKLSLSAMLTFIRQSRTIKTFRQQEEAVTTLNGVGDAFVLLKYQLINTQKEHPTELVVGTGPKFPTGKNDVEGDNGILLAPDLQPGTGSWDVMTWGYFGRQNFLSSGMQLASYLNYRITTPTTRANSSQAYTYGNEFQANVGLLKSLAIGKVVLDPSLFFVYRNLGPDEVDGDQLANTGGQWLYIKPGIGWQINLNNTLRVAADIPAYQHLKGEQLGTTYQIQVSFNHNFSL